MKLVGKIIASVLPLKRGEFTFLFKKVDVPLSVSTFLHKDDVVSAVREAGYGVIVADNISGVNVTYGEPKTASGDWIDYVQLSYRIKEELQKNIFSAFINSPKIGNTKDGISLLISVVQLTLESIGPLYNIKLYTDDLIVGSDRSFSGLRFSAVYDGAIQATEIRGEISA